MINLMSHLSECDFEGAKTWKCSEKTAVLSVFFFFNKKYKEKQKNWQGGVYFFVNAEICPISVMYVKNKQGFGQNRWSLKMIYEISTDP